MGGLYWVATTRENVSPSLVIELLLRMYWVVRVRGALGGSVVSGSGGVAGI
jgi:hypothetical protein